MVAIGRLKVAPVDPFQAVIEGELIAAVAKAEPMANGCLERVLQLEALVPQVACLLVFLFQEGTLA